MPDGARSGRNKRSSGPVPREITVSKKLSFLLRHGAEKQGLKLGVGGYVNVADVLSNQMIKSAHVTFAEVKQVVANNEKKRFGLAYVPQQDATKQGDEVANAPADPTAAANQGSSTTDDAVANEDDDPAHYLIRANQGHSIKLEDTSDLLTPITIEAGNLPAVVVHGTRHEVWPAILDTGGLKPMTRNHVHFATGVPEKLRPKGDGVAQLNDGVAALSAQQPKTPEVVSGMRVSSTILIFLDLRKALERGLKFFMSENGVVLSEGDDNGVVSLDFFERVEEKSGQVLVEHGKVVSELKGYAGPTNKSKKNVKPKLNTKGNRFAEEDEDASNG